MTLRMVQLGQGPVRPIVIVYNLTAELDDEIKKAAGPDAVIANDTRAPFQNLYSQISPLSDSIAEIQGKVGPTVRLGPVLVAGFSEGGSATQRVLALGGNPDAMVIADGSHAPLTPGTRTVAPHTIDGWTAYAEKARSGEKVLVASHTSLIYVETMPTPYASTWRVLRDATGFDLPLGTGAAVVGRPADVPAIEGAGPVKHMNANLVVYSYPGADAAAHIYQAKYAIGMMIAEALSKLGVLTCDQPDAPSTTTQGAAGQPATCQYYPEHTMPVTDDGSGGGTTTAGTSSGPGIGTVLAVGGAIAALFLLTRKGR